MKQTIKIDRQLINDIRKGITILVKVMKNKNNIRQN
jgi:hypothetical protein